MSLAPSCDQDKFATNPSRRKKLQLQLQKIDVHTVQRGSPAITERTRLDVRGDFSTLTVES